MPYLWKSHNSRDERCRRHYITIAEPVPKVIASTPVITTDETISDSDFPAIQTTQDAIISINNTPATNYSMDPDSTRDSCVTQDSGDISVLDSTPAFLPTLGQDSTPSENTSRADNFPRENTTIENLYPLRDTTLSEHTYSANTLTPHGDATFSEEIPRDEVTTLDAVTLPREGNTYGDINFADTTQKLITDPSEETTPVMGTREAITFAESATGEITTRGGEVTMADQVTTRSEAIIFSDVTYNGTGMSENETTTITKETTGQVTIIAEDPNPTQTTTDEDTSINEGITDDKGMTSSENISLKRDSTIKYTTSSGSVIPREQNTSILGEYTTTVINISGEDTTDKHMIPHEDTTGEITIPFGGTIQADVISPGMNTTQGQNSTPDEDATLTAENVTNENTYPIEDSTPSELLSTKNLTPYVDTNFSRDTTLTNVNISGEEVTREEVTTFDAVTFPGEVNTSKKDTTFDMDSGTDTTKNGKTAPGEATTPVIGTSPREDITFVESTVPSEVTAVSDGTYNGTGMSEYGTLIIAAETTGSVTHIAEKPTPARGTTPDEVTVFDKGITNTESITSGENISVNEANTSSDTTSSINMPTDEDNTFIEDITVVGSFPFGENTTFGKDTSKIITDEMTTFGLVISLEQNTTLLEEDITTAIDIPGEYTSNKNMMLYENSTGEFTTPFEETSQIDVTTPGRITTLGQNSSSSEDATLAADYFPSENVTDDILYPTEDTTTPEHKSTKMLTPFEDTTSSRDTTLANANTFGKEITQDQVTNFYGVTFSIDRNTFEKDTTFDIISGTDTSRKEITDPSEDTTPVMNINSKESISSVESTVGEVTIADNYATKVIETTGRVTIIVGGPAQNMTVGDTSLDNGITSDDEVATPDEATTFSDVTDPSEGNTPVKDTTFDRDINSGKDTTRKENTITTPVMGTSLREDITFDASTTSDETAIASQDATRSESFSGDTYSSTGVTEHGTTTSVIGTTGRVTYITRDSSPAQNTTPDEDSTMNEGMTYSSINFTTSNDRTSDSMTLDVDDVYVEHTTIVENIALGKNTIFDKHIRKVTADGITTLGEFTTVKDTIPADSTAPGKYAIFSEVAIPENFNSGYVISSQGTDISDPTPGKVTTSEQGKISTENAAQDVTPVEINASAERATNTEVIHPNQETTPRENATPDTYTAGQITAVITTDETISDSDFPTIQMTQDAVISINNTPATDYSMDPDSTRDSGITQDSGDISVLDSTPAFLPTLGQDSTPSENTSRADSFPRENTTIENLYPLRDTTLSEHTYSAKTLTPHGDATFSEEIPRDEVTTLDAVTLPKEGNTYGDINFADTTQKLITDPSEETTPVMGTREAITFAESATGEITTHGGEVTMADQVTTRSEAIIFNDVPYNGTGMSENETTTITKETTGQVTIIAEDPNPTQTTTDEDTSINEGITDDKGMTSNENISLKRDSTIKYTTSSGSVIPREQNTSILGEYTTTVINISGEDTTDKHMIPHEDTTGEITIPFGDTIQADVISPGMNTTQGQNSTPDEDATLTAENVTNENTYPIEDSTPSELLSTKNLTRYVDTNFSRDTTLTVVNISGEEVTREEVTTFDAVTFPGEVNTSKKDTTFDMDSGTDTTKNGKTAPGEATTPVIDTSPREDITFVESTVPSEVTAVSDGTYNGTGMSEYGTPIIAAETTGSVTHIAEKPTPARGTTPDEVTVLDKGITNTESITSGENISVNEANTSSDTTSSINMPTDEDNTFIEDITVVGSFPFGENTTFGKDTSKIITDEMTTFGLVISLEQNTTLLEEDITTAIDIPGEYTSNKNMMPYENSTGEFTTPFEETSQIDVTTPGRITTLGQNSSSSEDATLAADYFPSENVTDDILYPTEDTTTPEHKSTKMLTPFEDTTSSRDTTLANANTFDTSRKEITDPSEDTTPVMNINSKESISSVESTVGEVTIADHYATKVIETTGRVTIIVGGPAQNMTVGDTSLDNGITSDDEVATPDEATTFSDVTDPSEGNTPVKDTTFDRDINSGKDTTRKENTASSAITTPVMGTSLREDITFDASTTSDETAIASQDATHSESFSGDTYSSTGVTEHGTTTSVIGTTGRVTYITRDSSPAQNTTPDEDSTMNEGMTYSSINFTTSNDRTSDSMTLDVDDVYVETHYNSVITTDEPISDPDFPTIQTTQDTIIVMNNTPATDYSMDLDSTQGSGVTQDPSDISVLDITPGINETSHADDASGPAFVPGLNTTIATATTLDLDVTTSTGTTQGSEIRVSPVVTPGSNNTLNTNTALQPGITTGMQGNSGEDTTYGKEMKSDEITIASETSTYIKDVTPMEDYAFTYGTDINITPAHDINTLSDFTGNSISLDDNTSTVNEITTPFINAIQVDVTTNDDTTIGQDSTRRADTFPRVNTTGENSHPLRDTTLSEYTNSAKTLTPHAGSTFSEEIPRDEVTTINAVTLPREGNTYGDINFADTTQKAITDPSEETTPVMGTREAITFGESATGEVTTHGGEVTMADQVTTRSTAIIFSDDTYNGIGMSENETTIITKETTGQVTIIAEDPKPTQTTTDADTSLNEGITDDEGMTSIENIFLKRDSTTQLHKYTTSSEIITWKNLTPNEDSTNVESTTVVENIIGGENTSKITNTNGITTFGSVIPREQSTTILGEYTTTLINISGEDTADKDMVPHEDTTGEITVPFGGTIQADVISPGMNTTQGQTSTPVEDATLAADNVPRENITSENTYPVEDSTPSEFLSTQNLTPYADTNFSRDTTLTNVNISGEEVTREEVTTFDAVTFPGEVNTSKKDTTFDMDSGTDTTQNGKTVPGEATTPVIGTSPREDITVVESTTGEVTITDQYATRSEATTSSYDTDNGIDVSENRTTTTVVETTGRVTVIVEDPAQNTTDEDTLFKNISLVENSTFSMDTSNITTTNGITTIGLVISPELNTTILEEGTSVAIDIPEHTTSSKNITYEDTAGIEVTTGDTIPVNRTTRNSYNQDSATPSTDNLRRENTTEGNFYPIEDTASTEYTTTAKTMTLYEITTHSKGNPFAKVTTDKVSTPDEVPTFGDITAAVADEVTTRSEAIIFSDDIYNGIGMSENETTTIGKETTNPTQNATDKDTSLNEDITDDEGMISNENLILNTTTIAYTTSSELIIGKNLTPNEDSAYVESTTVVENIATGENTTTNGNTTIGLVFPAGATGENTYPVEDSTPSELLSTKKLTPYIETTSSGDTTLAKVNITGEKITQDEVTTPVTGTSPRKDITFVESTVPSEVSLANQGTTLGGATAVSDGTYNGTGMSEYGTPIIVAETTGSVTHIAENPTPAQDTAPVTVFDKGITITEMRPSDETNSVNEGTTITYTTSSESNISVDEGNTYIENITVAESIPFGENTTIGKDTKLITGEITTVGVVISVEQNTTLLEEDITASIDFPVEYTSSKSMIPYEDTTNEFTDEFATPLEDTSQIDVTTPGTITTPSQNSSSSEDATLAADNLPSENVTGDIVYPTEDTTTAEHMSTKMLTLFEHTISSKDTTVAKAIFDIVTFSSDGNTFDKDTTLDDVSSDADTSRKEITNPSEYTTPFKDISSRENITAVESTVGEVTITDQYATRSVTTIISDDTRNDIDMYENGTTTTVVETTGRVSIIVEDPAQDTSLNDDITYDEGMTFIGDTTSSDFISTKNVTPGEESTHVENTTLFENISFVENNTFSKDTGNITTTDGITTIGSVILLELNTTIPEEGTYAAIDIPEHMTSDENIMTFEDTTAIVTTHFQDTIPVNDTTYDNTNLENATLGTDNLPRENTTEENSYPIEDTTSTEYTTTAKTMTLYENTTHSKDNLFAKITTDEVTIPDEATIFGDVTDPLESNFGKDTTLNGDINSGADTTRKENTASNAITTPVIGTSLREDITFVASTTPDEIAIASQDATHSEGTTFNGDTYSSTGVTDHGTITSVIGTTGRVTYITRDSSPAQNTTPDEDSTVNEGMTYSTINYTTSSDRTSGDSMTLDVDDVDVEHTTNVENIALGENKHVLTNT
ncbi:mucin-17-like [Penaeus monodon]|uniref:mucin-17-like n=1 Tax=Penaeus monodon TaxID=6687 RepID=UPI0018A7A4FB|nr:mucin-17-like [Penaeus monodon]